MKQLWILPLTCFVLTLSTAQAVVNLDSVKLEDRPRPANNVEFIISRRSIPAGHYEEKIPEAHLFDGGYKDQVAQQPQEIQPSEELQPVVPQPAVFKDASGRNSQVRAGADQYSWMPAEGGVELNKVPPAVALAFWTKLLERHSAKKEQTGKILDAIFKYVEGLRKSGLKTGEVPAEDATEVQQKPAVLIPSLNHTETPAPEADRANANHTGPPAPQAAAPTLSSLANHTVELLAPLTTAPPSVSSANYTLTAPLAAAASLNHTGGPPIPTPLVPPRPSATTSTTNYTSETTLPPAPSKTPSLNHTSPSGTPAAPLQNPGDLPKGFSTASAVQPEIVVAPPTKTDSNAVATQAPPAVSTPFTPENSTELLNLNGSLPLGYSTASSSQPFVQEAFLTQVPKEPEAPLPLSPSFNSTKEPDPNPPIFSLLLDPDGSSDLTFRHHGNGREREFAAQILQMGIQGHTYPVMVVQPIPKAKADFDFEEDSAGHAGDSSSSQGPAFSIHLPLQQSHSQFQIPRLSFTMPVLFLPGLVFSQSQNLEKNAHELQVRFPEPGTDYGVFPISHLSSGHLSPAGRPLAKNTSPKPMTNPQLLDELPEEVEGGKETMNIEYENKGPADASKEPSWGLSLNALFNASAHVESPKPNLTSALEAKGPQLIVSTNILHSQAPGVSHHGSTTVWMLNGGNKPNEIPEPGMQVTVNHQVEPESAEDFESFESPALQAEEEAPLVSEPVTVEASEPEPDTPAADALSTEVAPKPCPTDQISGSQVTPAATPVSSEPDDVFLESEVPNTPEGLNNSENPQGPLEPEDHQQRPPEPQDPHQGPPEPRDPHQGPPEPLDPHQGPPEPQDPHQGPPEPQDPHQGPPEPQDPHQGPPEPQDPHQGPPEPQDPHQGPSEPQDPHQGPPEPQDPHQVPSEPQDPHQGPPEPQGQDHHQVPPNSEEATSMSDPRPTVPHPLTEEPEYPETSDLQDPHPSSGLSNSPSNNPSSFSWPPKPPTEDAYFSTSNFKPLLSYPSLHQVPIISQAAQNLGVPLNPFRPPVPLAHDTSLDDILSNLTERLISLYAKAQSPQNTMSPEEYSNQVNQISDQLYRSIRSRHPPAPSSSYHYIRGGSGSDPTFQRPQATYTTKYFHDSQDPGPNIQAQIQDVFTSVAQGPQAIETSAELRKTVSQLTSEVFKILEQNKHLLKRQKQASDSDSTRYRSFGTTNFNTAPTAQLPSNWPQIKALIDALGASSKQQPNIEPEPEPVSNSNQPWIPPTLDDFLRSSNSYPKRKYYNMAPPTVKLENVPELTKPTAPRPHNAYNPFRRPSKPKPRDKLSEERLCGVSGDHLCAATCVKMRFKKGSCLSLHGEQPECVCNSNDETSEVAFNVEILHGGITSSGSSQPTSPESCQATGCSKSCLVQGFLIGSCDGSTCVCGRTVVI